MKYKGAQSGKLQRWDWIPALHALKAGVIYETHQVPVIFRALRQAQGIHNEVWGEHVART